MKYNVYYSPIEFYEENEISLDNRKNHTGYSYSECPVWGHMNDRTFIGYSPVDFFLKLNSDSIEYKIDSQKTKKIYPFDIDGEEFFDETISFMVNDIEQELPVFQLSFVGSYFWTDFQNDYLWFEFLDHPLTALNNNFITVSGWFNIANHPRSTSLAVKMQNPMDQILIKKGDPLYRVRFYTNNMNDKPILTKKQTSSLELDAMDIRRSILTEDKKFMNQILFDKDVRNQCPYHEI